MDVICSPSGIVYPKRPGQGITDIANAGFQKISLELSHCCSAYELEHCGEPVAGGKAGHENGETGIRLMTEVPSGAIGYFQKMLDICQEKGLEAAIARAPHLPRETKRTDLTKLLIQLSEESIRTCGSIGCRYLVIPPLFAGIAHGDEWAANRAYYLSLVALARENQVIILLENQCRNTNGHLTRGLCSDGTEAAEWIDQLNHEAGEVRFGFCMDVGVCSLCGQNMHDFALALGARLRSVVLRDCNGDQESSLLPFTCIGPGGPRTDWLSLFRGLREIGFDGQLLLDFSDTASAFSPLLRPQLMQLAKTVAGYFKWQIEIENLLKKYPKRVLFGAGNMCRNYMKCYGEKYPPLFTCDNNRALWGTEFCGLRVRAPECLLELPEDCAIFICNIYYREIEKQLREMGVANPVEFFNDEYMPAFYFDRLKEQS